MFRAERVVATKTGRDWSVDGRPRHTKFCFFLNASCWRGKVWGVAANLDSLQFPPEPSFLCLCRYALWLCVQLLSAPVLLRLE